LIEFAVEFQQLVSACIKVGKQLGDAIGQVV